MNTNPSRQRASVLVKVAKADEDTVSANNMCDSHSTAKDSLGSIVFSNQDSLKSFKKFRDSIIQSIQQQTDQPLTVS